jgi:hypothetical protein
MTPRHARSCDDCSTLQSPRRSRHCGRRRKGFGCMARVRAELIRGAERAHRGATDGAGGAEEQHAFCLSGPNGRWRSRYIMHRVAMRVLGAARSSLRP